MTLRLIAMVVACSAMVAHASEMQDRAAISAEVQAAFERSDFAAIEARYARALSGKQRLASGVFVSGRIVRELVPDAPTGADVPKGADAFFQPIEERARAWTAHFPKSVIAAIALSQAYRFHGWAYRGEGAANSVTKEDFAKFEEYVGRSRGALLAREDTGRADPNWHWQVLEVARLQNWPEREYFAFAQAALEAFPDHYDTYFEISNRLVPRWGGSFKALAAFADHAVERTKADEGQALYARIYWYAFELIDTGSIRRGDLDWPRIRAGFDDVVKRYPDPWNLNNFARIACNAEDRAAARRILKLVGDNIEPSAWGTRGAYIRCKNLAEN